jgi:hypothetical protein
MLPSASLSLARTLSPHINQPPAGIIVTSRSIKKKREKTKIESWEYLQFTLE